MRRSLGRGLLLSVALLGAGLVAGLAQPPRPAPQVSSCAERAAALAARLAQPVNVDLPNEEMPLKDALGYFRDKFEIQVLVNYNAFPNAAGAGMVAAGNPIDDQPVRLPKVKGVRLSRVLDALAGQVHAVWLIRCDHIELTSRERRNAEVGIKPSEEEADAPEGAPVGREALPLVCLSVKDKPLTEVLAKLSDQYERTVLVASAANEKARRSVSAEMVNVPFDTAVLMLADMADLYVMPRDNAYYITTPERTAAYMREEFERQKRQMMLMPSGAAGNLGQLGALGIGSGGLGGFGGGMQGTVGPAPGTPVGLSGLATAGENTAELQRQNEELRRELEELKRQPKKPGKDKPSK